MPKSTLILKSTVIRRQTVDPVPSDMAERMEQFKHHQSADNAATTVQEAPTALEPAKSGKRP